MTVPEIELTPMHIWPLVIVTHGVPSLKMKLVMVTLLHAGDDPTKLKMRLSRLPAPASGVMPKTLTTSWPGFMALGVTVKPLLSVPVLLTDGLAGWITAGLKFTTN